MDADRPREPRRRRRERFGARRRSAGFLLRMGIYVVAGVCVVIGLAGIVLPLLPGWPFLIVGLALLTSVNPWVRGALHRFLDRHPRLDATYLRVRGAFTKKKPPAGAGVPTSGAPPSP
jgi:hypothetical protein